MFNDRYPFTLKAASKLSSSMENLDLSVDVSLPFDKWEKDAFQLKVEKKRHHIKTILTEKRKGGVTKIRDIEGTSDSDILTNMLDYTTTKITELKYRNLA